MSGWGGVCVWGDRGTVHMWVNKDTVSDRVGWGMWVGCGVTGGLFTCG